MLARSPRGFLTFPCRSKKNRSAGTHVMTNTSERATTKVFGLSLTAVFLGLLILNGISF